MQIQSITPATSGWVASYKDEDEAEFLLPVAVWAVIKDDDELGHHRVVGLVGNDSYLDNPEEDANFLRYEYNP